MASVYKSKRDKKRKGSCWSISYSDENGKSCWAKGFTDKRSTEELAREIEREVKRKKHGLVNPTDEKRKSAANTPIAEHLAAFKKSISRNSGKHVKLTISRVTKLVEEAEFKVLADIDIESIEAVLGDMLDSDEIGHRTYNHYVQAMSQFCAWLVPNRLEANPVLGMKRLNPDVDVRHPRRALSQKEFAKLVQSARESGVDIQCYDGEQRARIYTLSYMTGLRRKEIASLTPASFDLKAKQPTLTVEAACSKHRRKDELPLHPELVTLLKDWLQGIGRDEFLFPKLAKRRTWLMVKKDLERVDIAYRDEKGRVADFHAAGRHTHITELLRNGASIPEALKLARHSDVRQTMKYTHIGLDDQAKALTKLPWQRNEKVREQQESNEDETGQWPASETKPLNGHPLSSAGNKTTSENQNLEKKNPRFTEGSDAARRDVSSSGTESACSGGGGNRTRVLRLIDASFYVCSQGIWFRPAGALFGTATATLAEYFS